MKIRGKLGLGFALVLIITGIISVSGIFFITRITNDNIYARNYPSYRFEILNSVATEIMDMRRVVMAMAFYAGNEVELNRVYGDFNMLVDRTKSLLDGYAQSFRDDPRMFGEEQSTAVGFAIELKNRVILYVDDVVYPMFETAMYDPNNRTEISRIIARGVEIHTGADTPGTIESLYSSLKAAAQETLDEINNDVTTLMGFAVMIMVVLPIIGIVVGIVVAMVIANKITKPIQSVVVALGEVTQGKLNINIERSNIANDEPGMLIRDVLGLVDVIKAMVQELTIINHEYNELGNSKYRMDSSKFQNSFRDMIENVNKIFDAEVENIDSIVKALNQINAGDFDNVRIYEMAGDFAVQPEALRTVLANLKAISGEVRAMIEAAAVKGDLNFHIDANKYTGDWREIMNGLNQVAEAVERPVAEIRKTMNALNAGKFDTLVTGNYAGSFLDIKNDVNQMVNNMASYISEIDECLSEVAEGNLNRKISMDFVGDFNKIKLSIEHIVKILHKTISEISVGANQLLSGARQISASANNLATGAQQQASSVQELNATIDIISQQTRQNADNAVEANELSSKSTANAIEGNEAMKQMLAAMVQIKESSSNISKVIKVIQDITFQTNLLSLNAAVEAARAGDQGKGFGVVAEEVRSLAARSQQATIETTGLIGDSISRVDAGSSIALSTSESLDIIVKNASEVMEIINSISIASKEQALAIAQVSDGLSQISQVVQSNSAVSEETAAASQELNSQAELLQHLVAYFKL